VNGTMACIRKDGNFYERLKPRIHRRIGRELRLAGTIVDIGCGSCELVRYLAATYGQKVTGVDVASGSFPRNRHTRTGARFRCVRRDACNLDFLSDQSVDAVVTMCALHEMDRPGAILAEARRILRPGGEVLVVDFPRDSLAQQLWNENYYSTDEVEKLLAESGFGEIRVKTIERGQLIWATAFRACVEESD